MNLKAKLSATLKDCANFANSAAATIESTNENPEFFFKNCKRNVKEKFNEAQKAIEESQSEEARAKRIARIATTKQNIEKNTHKTFKGIGKTLRPFKTIFEDIQEGINS